MSEQTINHETHKDPGSVCLGLKTRYSETGAWEKIKAIRSRIHGAYVSGDDNAQIFEEGPVLLFIPPRAEESELTGEALGNASSWLMDFRSDECARMHNHPLGERVLNILPDSPFQVWSATPIDVSEDLDRSGVKVLEEDIDEETGKTLYGIEIPPYTEFSVQIPKGTTHRFLGSGVAESIHPNELAEIAQTGHDPDMAGQTLPWSERAARANQCSVHPAEKRNPNDAHEELQRGAIERLGERLAEDGFITERDIFRRFAENGNRVSLFKIHSALSEMHKAGSEDVMKVELMDEQAKQERAELTGIDPGATTKVFAFRESALAELNQKVVGSEIHR